MIPAIYDRRSIRKFLDKPLAKEDIREIIQSGIKAPSSKNRQPWKFIIVQGREKEEMLKAFRRGIAREENGIPLLPESGQHIASAKYTVEIMDKAPVTVFVVNTLGRSLLSELTTEERVSEICNIQSIGASIENMLLAATEKGIGGLWICDIFFAYAEISEWLGCEGQLAAAVAFGYSDETPMARPRNNFDDVVVWRS